MSDTSIRRLSKLQWILAPGRKKRNEGLRIMLSILTLTVLQNGSTIWYRRGLEVDEIMDIETLPAKEGLLMAEPIANASMLLLLLVLFLVLRTFIGCMLPNRYSAEFYSALKKSRRFEPRIWANNYPAAEEDQAQGPSVMMIE